VMFHDTKVQTAAMLPAFLHALREQNYRVVSAIPAP
jgi:peptidoglycan-N-acetylglucosamine deacetylase